jgi:hypothetical protein
LVNQSRRQSGGVTDGDEVANHSKFKPKQFLGSPTLNSDKKMKEHPLFNQRKHQIQKDLDLVLEQSENIAHNKY